MSDSESKGKGRPGDIPGSLTAFSDLIRASGPYWVGLGSSWVTLVLESDMQQQITGRQAWSSWVALFAVSSRDPVTQLTLFVNSWIVNVSRHDTAL